MMYQVEIDKAKLQLSSLIETALKGEVIIITQDGQPVLKLTPIAQSLKKRRQSGSAKGLISMSDDFDQPLFEVYSINREW